jgi:hypothetical protein
MILVQNMEHSLESAFKSVNLKHMLIKSKENKTQNKQLTPA